MKKILVSALVLTLLLGSFTGCGKKYRQIDVPKELKIDEKTLSEDTDELLSIDDTTPLLTALLAILPTNLPILAMLNCALHQHFSRLTALGLVLGTQLVAVLVDRAKKAGQSEIDGGRKGDDQQNDRNAPADRLAAGQTEEHRKQASDHTAGDAAHTFLIENADHF